MSIVKQVVLRNRLQTLILNNFVLEQIIAEAEKFFPNEINIINKGNNHEIWIVYDDSRPRVHLINVPITKAKNV